MPKQPRPIAIIGAGGIVQDAHLPGYKKAGWRIFGIYDPNKTKAEKLVQEFNVEKIFDSLEQMIAEAPENVVFDVAVPASALIGVLQQLPQKAVVLMQKPMGENIQEADAIKQVCRSKNFTAAMNFQWRFIPAVIAARNMIDAGIIGDLHDMEIRMKDRKSVV